MKFPAVISFILLKCYMKWSIGLYNKTLFLRIWAVIFGAIGLPVALFSGGFSVYLFAAALACFVAAVPIFLVVSLVGDSLGNFLFGLGKQPDKESQLAGDLLKARHSMAEGNLIRAEEIIDYVVYRHPEFTEALFLQAEIAMRKGDEEIARNLFKKIVLGDNKKDKHHHWSLNYLRELNEVNGIDHKVND